MASKKEFLLIFSQIRETLALNYKIDFLKWKKGYPSYFNLFIFSISEYIYNFYLNIFTLK